MFGVHESRKNLEGNSETLLGRKLGERGGGGGAVGCGIFG